MTKTNGRRHRSLPGPGAGEACPGIWKAPTGPVWGWRGHLPGRQGPLRDFARTSLRVLAQLLCPLTAPGPSPVRANPPPTGRPTMSQCDGPSINSAATSVEALIEVAVERAVGRILGPYLHRLTACEPAVYTIAKPPRSSKSQMTPSAVSCDAEFCPACPPSTERSSFRDGQSTCSSTTLNRCRPPTPVSHPRATGPSDRRPPDPSQG